MVTALAAAVCLTFGAGSASAQCVDEPSPGGQASEHVGTNIWRFSMTTYKGDCRAAGAETWFTSANFTCTLGNMTGEDRCYAENWGGYATAQATQYGCGTYTVKWQPYWLLFSSGNSWLTSMNPSSADRTISCPPPPPQAWELGCNEWDPVYQMWWSYETEEYLCSSPILINLKKNTPYRLTSPQAGVLFDINGDGTLDQVAWTYGGDELAWLAIDLNENGIIDNGIELVGDKTNGAWNGFEALARIQEAARGRRYSILDADDAVYSKLLLWTDRNHDGISQEKELEPFSKELSGIQMGYEHNTADDRVDEHGNNYFLRGQVIKRTQAGKNPLDERNRDLRERTIFVYDVYLRYLRQ